MAQQQILSGQVVGGGSVAFCGASVYPSANQTIPDTTGTMLPCDSEYYDTDALHDGGSPTRLTVPAGKTGSWRITILLSWQLGFSAERIAAISVNGSQVLTLFDETTDAFNQGGSVIWPLSAGDYVEARIFQYSGGDKNIVGGTGNALFQMELVGQ